MHEAISTVSLAELAVLYPAASRIFQHYRLDVCRVDDRTLAVACLSQELNPWQVFAEIRRDSPNAWPKPTLEEIIEWMKMRYHRPTERELSELTAMAKKVTLRHQDRRECPFGLDSFLTRWSANLMDHMQKKDAQVSQ